MADMVLSDATTSAPGGSGTISTLATNLSTGQGIAFTPRSDKVLLTANGPAGMSTAGDNATLSMLVNTTGIPAKGSGATDSGAGYTDTTITNGEEASVSMTTVATGLTPGTKYYFYLSAIVSSGSLNYGSFIFTVMSV